MVSPILMGGAFKKKYMATKRQIIFNKFNGKCAYSGTDLKDDWQIDHVVPKGRNIQSWHLIKSHNDIENLLPVQKIINHYKRILSLEDFRTWYLGELHLRLRKLPKNPKTEKSIKRKKYLFEVASYFGITEEKPFSGKFYFEIQT